MGCDIHCYAEAKKTRRSPERQEWEKVGAVFPNPWHREGDSAKWNPKKLDSPYPMRNYNLFGILADVRNGRGFAGCKMGDGFKPIDQPRGLPEDASEKIKGLSNDIGEDGHSHSYFTLAELDAYDWDQISTLYGMVSEKEFADIMEDGKPKEWCGDVSGGSIVKITPDEMFDLINGKKEREDGKNYYTRVKWEETYRSAVGIAWFEAMEALRKLGRPDEVRIVFWFDN